MFRPERGARRSTAPLGPPDETLIRVALERVTTPVTAVTLHSPSHREALWELESAFDRGDLITVFGSCTVEYDGRAASSLAAGRRLLVLKPDGTALVHTDEGRTPVNWQPPGCEHRAAVRDGRLRVQSTRDSPEEELDVRFEAVDQLVAYSVSGRRDVTVAGTESDLRERLLDDPSLIEDGFEISDTERESEAGPIDVFGTDADGRPTVVELKRRRVGPDAVGQLGRYVNAIEREYPDGTEVRGFLIAPSVTERAAGLLAEDGFEHVALGPPEDDVGDGDGGGGNDSDDNADDGSTS
jgi:RecB family endonuclease NucS